VRQNGFDKKIVVIGRNNPGADGAALEGIRRWLYWRGCRHWAWRLQVGYYEDYDMCTRPEKGDALDAVDENTGLVVALHLYGIDQIPGHSDVAKTRGTTFYDRNNGDLLKLCMEKGAVLIAQGDQPRRGAGRVEIILGHSCYAYLPVGFELAPLKRISIPGGF
jgi:hypothetical protein